MTLNSYRIITTRIRKGDEEVYVTKVNYDGREVEAIPTIKEIHDEIELGKKVLKNNPNINRLEIVLSGEDLK
jgi:hypothetical protein